MVSSFVQLYTLCNFLYSKLLYVACGQNEVCELHESPGCMSETLTIRQYTTETTCLTSLLAWESYWLKILDTYTVMQSYIRIASTVMAFATEMMKGSSACSSWENCYIVGELMHIYKFCLNNFYKNGNFYLQFLLVG
jgi:hypothetical protein